MTPSQLYPFIVPTLYDLSPMFGLLEEDSSPPTLNLSLSEVKKSGIVLMDVEGSLLIWVEEEMRDSVIDMFLGQEWKLKVEVADLHSSLDVGFS